MSQTKQFFIATHSQDFVQGLLDGDEKRINILRIEKTPKQKVSCLSNHDIKVVWQDSMLKHSNVINALFHDQVIICESDTDNKFFHTLLYSLFKDLTLSIPDTLFLNSGGKQRITNIVKALKKLNVKIKVIVDFDILDNKDTLQKLFISLGGEWNEIESHWNHLHNSVHQNKPQLRTTEIKSQIFEILDSNKDQEYVPNKVLEKIRNISKLANPWAVVKSQGVDFFKTQSDIDNFNLLNDIVKHVGLYIIKEGEIEQFSKSSSGHGLKWVNQVLDGDYINNEELNTAKQFIKEIALS